MLQLRCSRSDLINWNELFDDIMNLNCCKCIFIEVVTNDNEIEFWIRPNDCGHLNFEKDLLGKYHFETCTIINIIVDIRFKISLFLDMIRSREESSLLN